MAGSYWIGARNAVKTIDQRMGHLEQGYVLKVESFKRDRWIEIEKLDGFYRFTEHGFRILSFDTSDKEFRTKLKESVEIEFPRSNQLRIHISKSR